MNLIELNPENPTKAEFMKALEHSIYIECDDFRYTFHQGSIEHDLVLLLGSGGMLYDFELTDLIDRTDVIIVGVQPASNDSVY